MAKDTKNEKQAAKSFKETLNLPTTDFPLRANAAVDDPLMLERWQREDLAGHAARCNEGAQKFILHDGPPYANGPIHLGHAFNKILKDITAKSQRMMGKHVPVRPGWDCHGLPIEFKVSQSMPGASARELRKACRAYAASWVDVQKKQFRDLAVLMEWERPYLTMSHEYESATVSALARLVEQGYIERKNKTVPWCSNCQTVLAAAEIEYEDRKDPSVYVTFALEPSGAKNLFPALTDKPINVLIWTTTPWTLPLNRAVLARPATSYVVIDGGSCYIVTGKCVADDVCSKLGIAKRCVAEVISDALAVSKLRVVHPFIAGLTVPIIVDPSVALDEGSAFVHCAPGCGPLDYDIGVRNNLEIFSPVGPDGRYTRGIVPSELEGMSVADGQEWVLATLERLGALSHRSHVYHSYPHCWRCHKGLIFRATKQWFCDLSRHDLRNRVLQALDMIHMVPKGSRNRLYATVEGRLEWCLSRQRVWGVPLPALICQECDYAHCTSELVEIVANKVAKAGIECWDDVNIDELCSKDFACPQCGGSSWRKEQDTLDVWFDAGVSHYAVLEKDEHLSFPADIYIEAQDQYRGWFQSSLLTSMALEKVPCMRTIFTHGFTVDEKGHKMSKSQGNVVSPQEMTEKLGIDGLRLWVASIDCSGDIVVSSSSISNAQEVLRKIRNTARFLLSNLYDFDSTRDEIDVELMNPIDRYALEQLCACNSAIMSSYREHDYTAVFHELAAYCSSKLSSFYLDIIKDRLYVEAPASRERRAAQTACWHILDTLTRAMAPIMSITAEQLHDHYERREKKSIHMQSFVSPVRPWESMSERRAHVHADEGLVAAGLLPHPIAFENIAVTSYAHEQELRWAAAHEVRSALLKAIEGKRETGLIKHSLEARLTIFCDPQCDVPRLFRDLLADLGEQTPVNFVREFLIVSQVSLAESPERLTATSLEGLYVDVGRAHGLKCPRCWQWDEVVNEDGLCARCAKVVATL